MPQPDLICMHFHFVLFEYIYTLKYTLEMIYVCVMCVCVRARMYITTDNMT